MECRCLAAAEAARAEVVEVEAEMEAEEMEAARALGAARAVEMGEMGSRGGGCVVVRRGRTSRGG